MCLLISAYYKCMIMSAVRYKCVPIYLLDTIYCHVVIGLMHIMEGALVLHIVSIAILTTLPKGITILFRYYQLPGKVLAINCRGMWTTKRADVFKIRIDMEEHIPKPIGQGQQYNHQKHNHGILQGKGTDTSGSVWCRSRSKSASEGQNVVPKEWSASQWSVEANSIHK